MTFAYRWDGRWNGWIFVSIVLCNICANPISTISAPNAYVNVPIYLDNNITINHNLNFLNGHNESQLNSTINLSSASFYPHLMQTAGIHKPTAHPPYFVAELAKQLDNQFRWIRDHEMEIPTIQRLFDAMGRGSANGRNDTKLVAQFAYKLERKLELALDVVNETTVQIVNLFHNFVTKLDFRKMSIELPTTTKDKATMTEELDRTIYMETMVLPCDSYDFDGVSDTFMSGETMATDGNIAAVHIKKKPADLLNFLNAAGHALHEHEDLNYTLNSQLLETLKAIDLEVPNFQNAYFLSKDNFGGDSNCRDHYSNQQFRYDIGGQIFIHIRLFHNYFVYIFRYLFTSAIKSKHIFLIIDHGASIANEEQYDLTKSFGNIR